MNRHPERQSSTINPSLNPVEFLLGEWNVAASLPEFPTPAHGTASVEWLESGAFLLVRHTFEQPGPPAAKWIVGKDDSADTYRVLYYDERGVSRIYKMSLEGTTWKMWRNAPGFSQRFTARLNEGGDTLAALWEKSRDGKKWENDVGMTYTRVT